MHLKLEEKMKSFGSFIFDNPLKVIVAVLILLAFPLAHVPQIKMDTSSTHKTNKALHENKEEYYTIPKDANLVSQELLLFENSGSDDLEDVVDSG
jgi:predicted RND superfamily exporter protein